MSDLTAPAAPHRVDARTVRAALKAAGIDLALRITSGRHATYVGALVDGWSAAGYFAAEDAHRIAAALRPLWNDGEQRVTVSTFVHDGEELGSVTVARAGWHRTAPLEAELEVLEAAGIDPVRVAELREDSTQEERTAELAVIADPGAGASGSPFLILGPTVLKLGDTVDGYGDPHLLSATAGAEWETCLLVGASAPVYRYRLARELLVRVLARRS